MKRHGLIVGIWMILGACLPLSVAASPPQAEASAKTAQGGSAEFKQAALKFLQSSQAYLAITSLQWENFRMAPQAGAVAEISSKNTEYKEKIGAEFEALMAMQGASEDVSNRLKDYYAAWGLAFDSMRPAAADSSRGFSARTNAEMQRMAAMASRVKMDL